MKISETDNLTERSFLEQDLEVESYKHKDLKHIGVRMPKGIYDYVNELKKAGKIANKTQFYNESFIEGLKTDNILIRSTPMHRIDIRVPEKVLNFIASNKICCRGELARNCIILGIEKYRTRDLKGDQDKIKNLQEIEKYRIRDLKGDQDKIKNLQEIEKYRTRDLKGDQDKIKNLQELKGIEKRFTVEMTISKVSEYMEWVWDNDYDGHYQPIISPRIEKTSYKMTLTQLNRFFENVVKKPLVITKFRITPN